MSVKPKATGTSLYHPKSQTLFSDVFKIGVKIALIWVKTAQKKRGKMENFAQNYVKLDIFGQVLGKSKISGGSPVCDSSYENFPFSCGFSCHFSISFI